MAGICRQNPILHLLRTTTQSPSNLHRVHGGARWCCCSVSPENENKTRTPPLLRLVVSGVTELLRLFSSSAQGNSIFDIFHIKAPAIYEGLTLAWKKGFCKVVTKSDKALLIDIIGSKLWS
ncbi:uncharacterized protein LOC128284136 isoform X2 [Gossypium arboreum]|uniref:uncharacterized protein LOC128284136 isoform X2 n=1 Tax=Gossypium arboreum TaxID=29729 RepID=UPI0022F19258|nr:uncharacterized protein LOC128284136 isoform X2 [Gossypium arboreum]